MEYGVNMPSSKIDDLSQFRGDTVWGKVCMKLKKLREAIEIYKGPSMSIDDYEWRWADDMITYMEKDGRKLTKGELEVANGYWKIYGKALQDN